jgi:dTDP-4-amino-4,6-dideoxygalactose transaminase
MREERKLIPAARPIIGDEEREAVDRVLRSGMMAQGPEVKAFEEEFSEFVGGRHCIAVNSGTSALHLGFLAAGLQPGDEVIVPSFSFAATANSVVLAGGVPVFGDIDPKTFNLDPEHAESLITPRTKGIMPVHLYGHIADMDAFEALGKKYGIAIFEDAAQAHLASLNGRMAGEWGTVASFSFYPTKNMTSGEGGMIVTGDEGIDRLARMLRNQGGLIRYQNEIVGLNNRMTDIHAAIGRVQVTKVKAWTDQRRKNARYLDEHLQGVITPYLRAGSEHSYHQYTIRLKGASSEVRDQAIADIKAGGVGCDVYYPTPIHRLPSFALTLDLPVTEEIVKEVISIPVHPSLTADELDQVVTVVNDVVKRI